VAVGAISGCRSVACLGGAIHRGDDNIALLVTHGLTGIDALVLVTHGVGGDVPAPPRGGKRLALALAETTTTPQYAIMSNQDA
jgi:hypothetical protein